MQQDVNNNMKVFDPSEVLKQNDIEDENKLIKNPSVSDGYKNFMIENCEVSMPSILFVY